MQCRHREREREKREEGEDGSPAAQRQPPLTHTVSENKQQVFTNNRPERFIKVCRKTVYPRKGDRERERERERERKREREREREMP